MEEQLTLPQPIKELMSAIAARPEFLTGEHSLVELPKEMRALLPSACNGTIVYKLYDLSVKKNPEIKMWLYSSIKPQADALVMQVQGDEKYYIITTTINSTEIFEKQTKQLKKISTDYIDALNLSAIFIRIAAIKTMDPAYPENLEHMIQKKSFPAEAFGPVYEFVMQQSNFTPMHLQGNELIDSTALDQVLVRVFDEKSLARLQVKEIKLLPENKNSGESDVCLIHLKYLNDQTFIAMQLHYNSACCFALYVNGTISLFCYTEEGMVEIDMNDGLSILLWQALINLCWPPEEENAA
jgi:hypothetical protein